MRFYVLFRLLVNTAGYSCVSLHLFCLVNNLLSLSEFL